MTRTPPAHAAAMRIRLLTYNVHKCIGGFDRQYWPERVRDTIESYSPDLVLLQEVDTGARRSRCDDQASLLGGMLGLPHRTFSANVTLLDGGAYGNAILSRFPPTETRNIDLTISPKKRRAGLHARYRVRLGDSRRSRTLHVYNLHLGLSGAERKAQLRRLLDSQPLIGLDRRTPVVVAGDFNDVWGTLGRKLLHPAGFDGAGGPIRTFPALVPLRALDGIYVRGDVELVRVFRSRLSVARLASDHLPLIADLRLG